MDLERKLRIDANPDKLFPDPFDLVIILFTYNPIYLFSYNPK